MTAKLRLFVVALLALVVTSACSGAQGANPLAPDSSVDGLTAGHPPSEPFIIKSDDFRYERELDKVTNEEGLMANPHLFITLEGTSGVYGCSISLLDSDGGFSCFTKGEVVALLTYVKYRAFVHDPAYFTKEGGSIPGNRGGRIYVLGTLLEEVVPSTVDQQGRGFEAHFFVDRGGNIRPWSEFPK